MGLAFFPLSTSPKYLTLSGTPFFFMNWFWLASSLLCLLDLFFLIGALAWFFKITKVLWSLLKGLQVSVLSRLYSLYQWFFYFSVIFRQVLSLCWRPGHLPFQPSVLAVVEAIQGALIWLERWSEYWCLPFNQSKCEATFFSVDPYQANLEPNFILFPHQYSTPIPRSASIPLQLSLGVTFDYTLSFSKHACSLKMKFFTCFKAYAVSLLHLVVPRKQGFPKFLLCKPRFANLLFCQPQLCVTLLFSPTSQK